MSDSLSFIKASLDKAHGILHETHEYIKWQAPQDIKKMDEARANKVSTEAMRITVRLTQVITWLLLRRALLKGDVTEEEALSEDYQVLQGRGCLNDKSERDIDIPRRLRELLVKSRQIYINTLKLDQKTREKKLTRSEIKKKRLKRE